MDLKLEVVPIPVSDVNAAKSFYVEQSGSTSTTTSARSRACGSSR